MLDMLIGGQKPETVEADSRLTVWTLESSSTMLGAQGELSVVKVRGFSSAILSFMRQDFLASWKLGPWNQPGDGSVGIEWRVAQRVASINPTEIL
jgi:hypothetical protein